MNEYKFRAFTKNQNGTYSCHYNDPLFPHIFWNNIYKGIYDRGPYQYTGSKDKNGIEIYEGDIINILWWNGYFEIGEVIFSQGMFLIQRKKIQQSPVLVGITFQDYVYQICKFTVIGNIYDNQDLLV